MTASARQEEELAALLTASGGLPIIQIVLDRDRDATSISCAGVDGAAIPRLLVDLGLALSGGTDRPEPAPGGSSRRPPRGAPAP